MIHITPKIKNGIYSISQLGDSNPNYKFSSKIYRKTNNFYEYVCDLEDNSQISKDFLEEDLYASLYIDNYLYKSYLKIITTNNKSTLRYSIKYKTNIPQIQCSTPFIDRCSFFMPTWSTAYKNSITNYSKLVFPLYTNIIKNFYKTTQTITESLKGKEQYLKYIELPKSFEQEHITVKSSEGITYKETDIIETSPISRISFSETKLKNKYLFSLNYAEVINKRLRNNCSKLYVHSKKGTLVSICGITTEGTYAKEDIFFTSSVTNSSLYNYSKILTITSSDSDTIVSNYLDTSKFHIKEDFEKISSFIDPTKNNSYPIVKISDNLIHTYFENNANVFVDSHKYKVEKNISDLYIENTGDIFLLDLNNNLYTSSLYLNLKTNLKLLDNNNNNKFIYLTQNLDEGYVEILIQTKELSELIDDRVVIKLENSKGIYYLNQDLDIVEDICYLNINKINDINIKLEIEESDFISSILETSIGNFQASYIVNKLSLNLISDNILKLLIINNEIYVETEKDVLKKINIFKDYYERSENLLLFYTDLEYTIETSKGVKINA